MEDEPKMNTGASKGSGDEPRSWLQKAKNSRSTDFVKALSFAVLFYILDWLNKGIFFESFWEFIWQFFGLAIGFYVLCRVVRPIRS